MIPDQDTLARLRVEAVSYADAKTTSLELFYRDIGNLPSETRALIATALRVAYLAGADAGYTARVAEERP